MRITLIGMLGAGLLLGGCQKEADAVAPALVEQQVLGQTWLESMEEEVPSSGEEVYRPDSFAFPASRPRPGFRFDPDGVYTGRGPSATDGLAIYPGRWTQESHDRLRIIPAGAAQGYGLQVLSLRDGVLRVRRLP